MEITNQPMDRHDDGLQNCGDTAPETVSEATSAAGDTEVPTKEVAEAPVDLTPAGLRRLRGQYFTVRHIPLNDCGHKMDVINFPRHRNCENCVWQWLNYHPKLVEAVDEAWQKHGKQFVVNLRGEKFANLFARFMATIAYFKKQEEDEKTKGQIREPSTDREDREG
jgi:hypothetical protein